MQTGDLLRGYEASYLRDVLGLEEGEREEEIDDRLIAEAKELGIDVEVKKISSESGKRPVSAMPALGGADNAPPPRRSSVDSRVSQATSVVSTASSAAQHANGQGNGGRTSRASLSLRDYDNFLARGKPEGRASMSFSPPKTPSASTSVFSLPLSSPESSPKKHYRLMRGLSMLKLNRADSVTSTRGYPHCPRDPLGQRRAVHKLPCGHRLCTQALRDTIRGATASETGSIPSCCGIPIPGRLVEHVMTQQEQGALLDRLEQWSQTGSAAPSLKSEARDTGPTQRPGALSTASRTVSNESKVDSVRPEKTIAPDPTDTRPEFQTLREEQTNLRARFHTWTQKQRADLSAKHSHARAQMTTRHEAAAESLSDRHNASMSEAEDKQVQAEATLRAQHAQEDRDSATALRHMEAYCAGHYVSTGAPHHRAVSAADVAELEHARRGREGMRGRQESAINVLRGEQARRLRLRSQRQEKEMVELRRAQRREELGMEREWTEEGRGLEEFVRGRGEGLEWRLGVRERILGVRLEGAGDGGLNGAGRGEGDGSTVDGAQDKNYC